MRRAGHDCSTPPSRIGRTDGAALRCGPSASAPAPDNSDGSSSAALVPLDQAKTAFGGLLAGLKNPRGPITPRLIEKGPLAGLHLLLYYNNQVQTYAVTARNPYWLSRGQSTAAGDDIVWSQVLQSVWMNPTSAPALPLLLLLVVLKGGG